MLPAAGFRIPMRNGYTPSCAVLFVTSVHKKAEASQVFSRFSGFGLALQTHSATVGVKTQTQNPKFYSYPNPR
nr:MAG: hypothetical protein [Cressdnaviricota sp.]